MTTYKGKRQRQFPTTIATTSFVRLYILHLLMEGSYYGNKLKEEISKRLNYKWSPSPGMIYPMLNKLESEGYIKGQWDEPHKRTIKRYEISESGMEHYRVMKRNSKASFENSLKIIELILKDIY